VIPLTLGHIVLVYTAALVLGVLFLWLTASWGRRRRECRRLRRCVQCMFCGTIYEPASTAPLPECPQCARGNERVPPPAV
jgi:hypothetical protein